MSRSLPNYCGPHGVRFNVHCPRCATEWLDTLTPIEQALVARKALYPLADVKQMIDDFRKLEAA